MEANMEAQVLCPEELCLGPVRPIAPILGLSMSMQQADLTIWTTETIDKGTRFLPWKGTLRSDKLPVFEKLPEFDVSEISLPSSVELRFWARYLREER